MLNMYINLRNSQHPKINKHVGHFQICCWKVYKLLRSFKSLFCLYLFFSFHFISFHFWYSKLINATTKYYLLLFICTLCSSCIMYIRTIYIWWQMYRHINIHTYQQQCQKENEKGNEKEIKNEIMNESQSFCLVDGLFVFNRISCEILIKNSSK